MQPGHVIEGKYRVERLIGEGAMGAIYEAVHLGLERRVAIKLLRPAFARRPHIVARFQREAQAAAAIGSDHIARVSDVGQTGDGLHFLVMELLRGEDLASVLQREGALAPDRAARLIAQACRGVGAAHQNDIVHRDLKPGNLFLTTRDDGSEWIKILDFGVAKFLDAPELGLPQLTETGSTLGTPYYMAPEQASGAKEVDHRSDIYSLGVILYEMLTGVRPYQAATFHQLMVLLATSDPPPPRSLRPEIPPGLEAVALRAMAKEREDRFASLFDMERALIDAVSSGDDALGDTLEVPAPLAFGDGVGHGLNTPSPGTVPPTALTPSPAPTPSTALTPSPGTAPSPPAPEPESSRPRARSGTKVALVILAGTLVALALGLAVALAVVVGGALNGDEPRRPPAEPGPAATGPAGGGEATPTNLPVAAGQVWSGSYLCLQGPTQADLRIGSVTGLSVEAVMSFSYALTGTNGAYAMRGTYQPETRRLSLQPGEWIQHPPGWTAVGIDGLISPSGESYTGTLLSPSCTTFDLRLER